MIRYGKDRFPVSGETVLFSPEPSLDENARGRYNQKKTAEERTVIDRESLHAALTAYAREKKLPGVSVCMMAGDETFAAGYGWQDEARTRPVDEYTVFGIASMGKSVTALCVCLLALEGRLSWDDPVAKWVPGFRIPGTPKDTVTLRHLARHTSGLPTMEPLEWSIACNTKGVRDTEWNTAMRRSAPNPMCTIGQLTDYIAHCPHPVLGEPGEYMSYSNEGYAVLCYAVDAAAGIPLERYMKEKVFLPLGMTRTVLDEDCSEARAIAGGNITSLFERDEDGTLYCDDGWDILPPFRGCACVKSCARDVARYYRCLSDHGMLEGSQVIPREAVDMLIGRAFGAEAEPVYCLGLKKRLLFGSHVLCEHSGGLHGTSTHGALLLGEAFGCCALSNIGDADTAPMDGMMINAYLDKPLDTKHFWLEPLRGEQFSEPELLTGTFVGHEGIPAVVRVTVQDGLLHASDNYGELELRWSGGPWFVVYRNGTRATEWRFHFRNGKAFALHCGSRMLMREEHA